MQLYCLLLTLLISLAALSACANPPSSNQNADAPTVTVVGAEGLNRNAITRDSVGAIQLTRLDLFAEHYRKPAHVVADYLSDRGENPEQFFATIDADRKSGMLVFHLWHSDA